MIVKVVPSFIFFKSWLNYESVGLSWMRICICIYACMHVWIRRGHTHTHTHTHIHTHNISLEERMLLDTDSVNTKKMNAWVNESNGECDVPETITSTEHKVVFLAVGKWWFRTTQAERDSLLRGLTQSTLPVCLTNRVWIYFYIIFSKLCSHV